MSDLTMSPDRARHSRAPFLATLLLVVVAGLLIYFLLIREHAKPPIKLALVTWTEDPFWDPLVRGANDAAGQLNVELTVIKSKPTVEAQTQHLRTLLDSGINGIAVSPNDAKAQQAILNEAAEKVAVVTFDSDAPETKRRRFVGIDNYAAGHVCAGEVREAMPDGGPILISVGSATMQHGRDRRQGLIDGLLERGFNRDRAADPLDVELKGPKYTIVATVTDGADPAKATTEIAAALKAHPEIKAVVGLFSYSGPSALTAIGQVGKAGQVMVVGFDEAEETQAALVAGTIHSSILQDSYRAGYESIQVLADEVRGVPRGPAEQTQVVNVPINVLTAQNVDEMRELKSIRQPAGMATTKPAS